MEIFYSRTAVKAINSYDKQSILAWDPDFTKVTPDEAAAIAEAEAEFAREETVRHEDIDWD